MIVVTGGAGFIGSNIAAALEVRGLAPVVVCDRLRDGPKWHNLAKRELFDIVHPDALFDFLAHATGAIAAVVHMGAVTATTATDGDQTIETNFRMSVRLWTWCADQRVPLIYASSAATYGDGGRGFDDDPGPEALARLRPLNLYGWSKHVFDRWVARRVAEEAPRPPQWVGLKFFNVYGPNEAHKGTQASLVPRLYDRARAGRAALLFKSYHPDYPDGGQLRDFVWVADCVDVVLWMLAHPKVSGLYNCGSGCARSFADLAAAVYRALGKEPLIEYVEMPEELRGQYQYFTEARLDRLREVGYDRPFTSVEEGVARYVRDYLETGDPYC